MNINFKTKKYLLIFVSLFCFTQSKSFNFSQEFAPELASLKTDLKAVVITSVAASLCIKAYDICNYFYQNSPRIQYKKARDIYRDVANNEFLLQNSGLNSIKAEIALEKQTQNHTLIHYIELLQGLFNKLKTASSHLNNAYKSNKLWVKNNKLNNRIENTKRLIKDKAEFVMGSFDYDKQNKSYHKLLKKA